MKKKFVGTLSISLLLFATLFSVAVTGTSRGFTMNIDNYHANAGDTKVIWVNGTWSSAWKGYCLKIPFDHTKLNLDQYSLDGTVCPGFTVWICSTPGDMIDICVSSTSGQVNIGSGSILKLTFSILNNAPSGITYLNLTTGMHPRAYYPNGNGNWNSPMYATPINGSVTIVGNNPPPTPNAPTGPTSGFTGIEYTYSTSPVTDPDGDSVRYQFDWDAAGAHDYSAWSDTPSSSQAWASAGTYAIKVRANDSKGATSGWSSPLQVVISPAQPGLEITSILGGKEGIITAVIKNTGTAVATSINWNITVTNGFILFVSTSEGTISSLAAGASQNVTLNGTALGIGIGLRILKKPVITAQVTCAEGLSAEKNVDARIFFKHVTIA